MPPQKTLTEEELMALPVLSDKELMDLPVIEDEPQSEPEGTGLGLGTIGRGVMRIPEVLGDRLGGLMNAAGDIPGAVSSLFGKGQIPLGMPNPIGDLRNAPTGVQALGNLGRDLVQRPGVVATAGGVGGAVAGGPLGWLTTALLGTSGAELGNQANQIFGTVADTPIGDDVEKAIAGGALDLATAGAGALAAKPLLAPARAAATDARTTGLIGAKLGANNSTVARRLVLGEDLARAEPTIAKLNPFKGIDPSDPQAFDKLTQRMSSLKESNIDGKRYLLSKADESGAKIAVTPDDVDELVESLRAQRVSVADDIAAFAKAKLQGDMKVKGDWRPGATSELENNRLVGISNKEMSPSQAQEYIRRNVDDELSKLGYHDNSTYANLLLDEKAMANMRLQTQGLNLVRKVMDKKLKDGLDAIDPQASKLLGEINENISALIDYEPAVRMAWASKQGALGVPHGGGLPGRTEVPGKLGQVIQATEPNFVANTMRTARAQKMQEQMLGPIQNAISLRQGGPGPLGTSISNLFGNAGGDMAGMTAAVQFLPRSAEMLEQNINEAAPVIHKAAFEQGMKATNGNPDVAGAMASRMTNEFVKVMQRGSPDEKRAVTAAIAKMNPQAFVAGDYPDEVDGAVYEPASKEQLSKNARQHFSNRAVDAITYAKQQQEAYKEGPSRILIRKTGQVSPEVLEQAKSMQDSAVFEEASSADY